MTTQDINAKVKKTVAKVLEIPPSKVTTDLSQKTNSTWDSLTHLKLVMELENTFKIAFKTDEVFAMNTVGKICYLVKKHIND